MSIAVTGRSGRQSRGFLHQMQRSIAGNVLGIAAASLIPMIIIMGAAIDMGRTFLAKDQLQGACDAAVLAARKTMVRKVMTTQARQAGNAFFNLNFPDGIYGAENPQIRYTVDSDGAVRGKATVDNAPSLFGDFGTSPDKIITTCAANLELTNTDVVFALDTTGSMNGVNPGDSINRLQAARNSIISFTSLLSANTTDTGQVRYGFVPFSSNVNVGFLLKPEWIVDDWTYQSRVANGIKTTTTTNSWNETTTTSGWRVVSGTKSTSSYTGDTGQSPRTEIGGGGLWCKNVPSNTVTGTTSNSAWVYSPYPGGGTQRKRTVTKVTNGKEYSGAIVGNQCIITVRTYSSYTESWTELVTPVRGSNTTTTNEYKWIYKPVTFDVSGVKDSSRSFVASKLGTNHTDVTVKWAGCIEERNTVRTQDFSPLPRNAYDLDIDRIPSSNTTRWRPFLPELVYWRKSNFNWDRAAWDTTEDLPSAKAYQGGATAVCPSPARKLASMSNGQVRNYVNSLRARGTTYLDIGMIWAARLISPTGLFRSENSSTSNGLPISRHIIFMTDGEIETLNYAYEAYGLSALDRRRTSISSVPSDADTNDLVDKRFKAACEAAKAKGITVWVIAFGTDITDSLKACASNDYYFQAENASELNQAFANIAADIARLRLIK